MKKAKLQDLNFRPVKEEDREFIYQVYASTRSEEVALSGWNETQAEMFLREQFNLQNVHIERKFKNPALEIIRLKRKNVGRFYTFHENDMIKVLDLALLPAHRNKGFGTKIMSDLIAEADKKRKDIGLYVVINNLKAIKFFEKLGFTKGEEKNLYLFMKKETRTR